MLSSSMSSTLRTKILLLLVASACWPLDVSVGSFTWPGSTGNFTPITGLPSQAKVLIVSNHLTSGTIASYDMGMGIATASDSIALHGRRGSGNGNASQRVGRIVHTWISTSTVAHSGHVVSFNSNSIDMNAVTVSTSYNLVVRWVAIGGSDLTGVKLVSYQSPTSTGSQQLTGAGFAPDAVVIVTMGLTCTPSCNDTTSIYHPALGVAAKNNTQAALGNYITLTNSEARRVQATDRVITLPTLSALKWEASVSSFDNDGITLNWQNTDSSSSMYFWVLYLKGPQATVSTFNQRTTTGQYSYTGLASFTPKGGIFGGYCNTAASGVQTIASFSLSLSSSGHRWSGINTNVGRSEGSSVLVCRNATTNPPPLLAEASFISWDAGGFTVDWTTADSTARQFFVLLLGDGGAPPAGKRRVIIQ